MSADKIRALAERRKTQLEHVLKELVRMTTQCTDAERELTLIRENAVRLSVVIDKYYEFIDIPDSIQDEIIAAKREELATQLSELEAFCNKISLAYFQHA